MKKSYFLSVCGGLTLMAGSAANAAFLFDFGPAGLQGTIVVSDLPVPPVGPTNVTPPAPNGFIITLTNLSGFNLSGGGTDPNTTITFANSTFGNSLVYTGNAFRLDPSPACASGPSPCTPPIDPSDPSYVPSSDTFSFLTNGSSVFTGTGSFSSTFTTLNFGPTAVGNPATGSITLDLTGLLTLGTPAGPISSPINSALTLAASNVTNNSMTLTASEVCGDPTNNACFETILSRIDAFTQTPGRMDDNFWVAGNPSGGSSGALQVPEPASLALLSAGLFGLGWTRRMQKAA